jgi:transposase InsO family protein
MRPALPPEQRLAIHDRHRTGESLAAIAIDLGIHYETARKWWREARLKGRAGVAERPRKPIGLLHRTPPQVVARLRQLRKEHPHWGVPYLRQQLLADPTLTPPERAAVPALSSLYRYLRQLEDRPPRAPLKNRVPPSSLVAQARYPHHLWQMDLKEKCRVSGLPQQISVANVRDVYSSVTVGAEVFALSRPNATLSGADMQAACRACFTYWGLPDLLRTDQGSCFVGTMPQTGFPSHFTLWLVGLDIRHETILKGQVTQNGCVERFNRTYNSLVLRGGPFTDLEELRQLSQETLDFLNTTYPSRAGTCQGRAPLQAHPQAATPRRPYHPARETERFSLDRVDAYLAQFRWQRRTDDVGKLSLGGCDYYLGREHKRRPFDVSFDPSDRHFVFQTPDGTLTLRRPALGLDAHHILHVENASRAALRQHRKR